MESTQVGTVIKQGKKSAGDFFRYSLHSNDMREFFTMQNDGSILLSKALDKENEDQEILYLFPLLLKLIFYALSINDTTGLNLLF